MISLNKDGEKEAYANIPLGAFSSLVKVHPSFRLIVHLPFSELSRTPMPFLNRLEKYTLSIRDVLAQRILEISHNPPKCLKNIPQPKQRENLFYELKNGVDDFVTFAGGISSFYGMSITETVPALILRALEDISRGDSNIFEPRLSVLAQAKKMRGRVDVFCWEEEKYYNTIGEIREERERKEEKEHEMEYEEIEAVEDMIPPANNSDSEEDYKTSISMEIDTDMVTDNYASGLVDGNDKATTYLKDLIRALNFQMMETARVESIFRLRDRLPAVYMKEYLQNQEHLSVVSFMHQLLKISPAEATMPGLIGEKLVVYTRTDSHLLRLVSKLVRKCVRE